MQDNSQLNDRHHLHLSINLTMISVHATPQGVHHLKSDGVVGRLGRKKKTEMAKKSKKNLMQGKKFKRNICAQAKTIHTPCKGRKIFV